MTDKLTLARVDGRAPKAHPAQTQDFWPVDSLESWRHAAMPTFTSWLAQQRILGTREFRRSSVETYTAMFSVWHQHLEAKRVDLVEATAADAASFFAVSERTAVSRRRYLQLLDRVYDHLAQCGRAGANPMQDELSLERVLDRAAPVFLAEDQQATLVAYLASQPGWKGARDRALAALLLGAGLRANEVAAQAVQDVTIDYVVKIRPTSVHRPHESLIVPDGPWRAWFDAWAQVRTDTQIPGVLAVPSTLKGKAVDPSTIFRRVKTWLNDAGIEAEQEGPNLLRSTFARNALACGRYTVEQVAEFMGHEDSRATARHLQGEQADNGLFE